MLKPTPFILQSISLTLVYVITAKISLTFATVAGNATLIWIPGGIALAITLLGGLRYLPAVFMGALLSSIMLHNPLIINLGTSIGNTLETYIAYTLLHRFSGFKQSLNRTKDLFVLIVLGGLVSPIASAVLGPLSLLSAGYISPDMLMKVLTSWWRADVLGIIFFTPITLLLLQKKAPFSNEAHTLEKLALWVTSFFVGQMILLDWMPPHDILDKPHGTAWIFLLILWASTRTGRKNTALLQLMFLTQALTSAYFEIGLFANDFTLYGLFNFWVFALLLATAGMMMAILNLENSDAFKQIKVINNRLNSMIEAIPDAIFFKDGKGHWLVVNESGKKLYQLDNIPWQGKTENELAKMRPEFSAMHESCLAGDNQTWDAGTLSLFNETVIDKDDLAHDYDVRKMPIFSKNGDRQSLVIIARDITKDKIAEAALRDSELRWKFALEGSGSGMWEYNFKTRINIVSKHLKVMLGFDVTSATYSSELNDWIERLHPDSMDETMNAFNAVMENQTDQYVIEQQVRCEDGSYKWLFTRGMIVDRDDDGKPLLMIGSSTDITEQQLMKKQLWIALQEKHTETESQNNELRNAQFNLETTLKRYRDLYEFSPAGHFTLTNQGIISEINLKGANMLSYGLEKLINRRFDQFIADEDKLRWRSLFLKIIKEENENENESFELKLTHKNNEKFYVHLNLLPTNDLEGTESLRVSILDITKLKQSEAALRVAAIAFESQEGMFVTDADNKILQVNRAFTSITGYNADEVIGRTPQLLSSGRHDKVFYAQMWKRLYDTGNWEGEIWNNRKNGTTYPQKLTITAVTDNNKNVSHYVATMIDITASKEQEVLRLSEEKTLRDTLVREVHHRIKNNLQGVAGLLINTAELNPMLKESLNAAISQVYSISVIHGLQGQNSMSHIPLCELCREIAINNEHLWRTQILVKMPTNIPLFQIAETETVPIALILNELMSNAVKHDKTKNGIEVILDTLPNALTAYVRIINTGTLAKNLDSPATPIAGTGLKLVKSLLPSEGATLSWEQHKNKVHTVLLLTSPVISINTKA